ncbi:hypothetical protein AAFF_G00085890 [Aldrovandia affinis]|uniref:Uncharacterized protein n=1 Tax=Aldrovandia affinis TaxID=143900 RepID=A0AAD7RWZ5_9TELE|nr:hypothetical protein AAFF_G00085890 [Aldrovandia affinis]
MALHTWSGLRRGETLRHFGKQRGGGGRGRQEEEKEEEEKEEEKEDEEEKEEQEEEQEKEEEEEEEQEEEKEDEEEEEERKKSRRRSRKKRKKMRRKRKKMRRRRSRRKEEEEEEEDGEDGWRWAPGLIKQTGFAPLRRVSMFAATLECKRHGGKEATGTLEPTGQKHQGCLSQEICAVITNRAGTGKTNQLKA